MRDLLETGNRHTIAVENQALIPVEQCQTILLDGEPFEDGDKFKYLGSMFVAKRLGHRRDKKQD